MTTTRSPRGPIPGSAARRSRGGRAPINWAAVPPGVFDAAENTVEWRIEPAEAGAKSVVQVELSGVGSPVGIAVQLRSAGIVGTGVLDADGGATVPLVDAQQQPMTESAAWDHDWRSTTVTVGVGLDESPQSRERIRDFARARLNRPADDAFLAEILAAESDY